MTGEHSGKGEEGRREGGNERAPARHVDCEEDLLAIVCRH